MVVIVLVKFFYNKAVNHSHDSKNTYFITISHIFFVSEKVRDGRTVQIYRL